ncbi:entericidin A/B family lipoprotein [Pontibaca methylaminivorans]|uniref:Entericidin EcnA/B family protein n=1 Tax=Pontibaca methylaminivorans TaxID=515897 RepID=A0A1R3X8E6_9RHOB|nr:entericidin A/B family lipoprotein [Pontibaca methylaminivorans]SIT86984.1 Entericidin EcnA/B family protein [Pontibaca methylaminivorans]
MTTRLSLPALSLLCVALFALAACETTKGFGEDVETLGSGISQEAEEAS